MGRIEKKWARHAIQRIVTMYHGQLLTGDAKASGSVPITTTTCQKGYPLVKRCELIGNKYIDVSIFTLDFVCYFYSVIPQPGPVIDF